ncbi:MAG: thioredoxin [Saprospiraceae bacterium]|nr:thioredoxin [Saprospiraceae bacterium]HRD81126.1 nitrophenyl compound nitroreductase subunit ArsF family protein [Saprospiraceae bacterium]
MRPSIQLSLLIVVSLFAVCTGQAQSNKKGAASASHVKQLEVVYFHSEHRCKTCLEIEKQTRAVLDKHFSKEVKSGNIVLKTYNVDEKANLKVCQKFDAFGSSLFLNKIAGGKEEQKNLTDFAFTNAFNAKAFEGKLVSYIRQNLP